MDFAPPQTGVRYMLLDMNSYFASVEQQLNPRLRGKPVAVVPMMADGTCAIAASKEAKAFGIKTGTKIYDAKQMCPNLICVMARHDVYVDMHHKILEEMVLHTPINKVWSIDEMNSRLTPNKHSVAEAVAMAKRLKEGLRRNVGEYVTCSIGLAPNSFLAKVASDMQKPDGLVVLEGGNLPGPLLDLDLRDLCGIGPNMEARLNRAGIWTIKQLWDTAPKQLRGIWGSVEGEKFWYKLHGYDVPDPPQNDHVVIGHSRVLDTDSRKPDVAKDIARRLTTKACQRLRRYNMYASSFSLSVRLMDGRRWARECHIHPANDTTVFMRLTHQLWDEMTAMMRPDLVKKVSMSLNGLRTQAQTTGDLFETPVEAPSAHRKVADTPLPKNNALSAAMDKIARAFGPHALHFGNQPRTQSGYVGTKIAFSRVPEREEFAE